MCFTMRSRIARSGSSPRIALLLLVEFSLRLHVERSSNGLARSPNRHSRSIVPSGQNTLVRDG
jgi:hypothetical protein